MSTKRFMALSAIVLVSVVALSACTPATPEERVAGLRARFDARVNGFYVEAEPQMPEPMFDAEAEGAETAEEATEEAAEGMEIEPEPVLVQNAHLDLILQHDNDDMLSGITVEIFMVGGDQQEKGRWRLWVDTSTLPKANQMQLVHVLEDVPYEEGDGFAAEIRTPIPAEEYGDYEEFSSLGG